MQGKVKWFSADKGYGFIAPDDGSRDVFVHINALTKSGINGLSENQRVSFDLEEGRNKKQAAANVKLV